MRGIFSELFISIRPTTSVKSIITYWECSRSLGCLGCGDKKDYVICKNSRHSHLGIVQLVYLDGVLQQAKENCPMNNAKT